MKTKTILGLIVGSSFLLLPLNAPATVPPPATKPATPAATSPAQDLGKTFDLGGRKAIHYADGRLVFFEGSGAGAKPVAEVDCKNMTITVFRQGQYVGVCSQFLDVAGPVKVYDATGKKVGEFQPAGWMVKYISIPLGAYVTAVSDSGIIALGPKYFDTGSDLVRLYDFSGKLLAGENNEYTRVRFSRDGVPIVTTNNPQEKAAAVLDAKGQVTAEYTPRETVRIRDLEVSDDASWVVFAEQPVQADFANQLTIWQPRAKKQATLALPPDLGAIGPQISVSGKGAWIGLRLGAAGLAVVRTADASFVYKKDVTSVLRWADNRVILRVLAFDVADDGSAVALCDIHAQSSGRKTLPVRFDKDGKVMDDVSIEIRREDDPRLIIR